LNKTAEDAQHIINELARGVDKDTEAFNSYIEAKRLPGRTPEEKKLKFEAEQRGLKEAVLVPFNSAQRSLDVIKLAGTVIEHGNPNSITDAGVGVHIAYSGVIGSIYNVLINLHDIKDEKFISDMKSECRQIKKQAEEKLAIISNKIMNTIN